MSDVAYIPKPGSIQWKVVKFLVDNPDEELTRGDIAVKFDTFGGSLDSALQLPVARGVLKKSRNSDGELVWMLASAEKVTLAEYEEPAPASLQTTAHGWAQQSPGPADANGFPVIRKNTPLLDEKSRRELEFKQWLAQFEVSSSAEFPENQLAEVKKHATRYGKASGVKFYFARTGPARWGMERKA